jgi:hypothetical protein
LPGVVSGFCCTRGGGVDVFLMTAGGALFSAEGYYTEVFLSLLFFGGGTYLSGKSFLSKPGGASDSLKNNISF